MLHITSFFPNTNTERRGLSSCCKNAQRHHRRTQVFSIDDAFVLFDHKPPYCRATLLDVLVPIKREQM